MVVQEKRKRERYIIKAYENQTDSKGEPITTYVKGGLAVGGFLYRKMVTPPTPKELVDVSTDQLEKILKYKTQKGGTIIQQGSRFTAYIADVRNYQQIRDVYKKMKMIQPNARHIVCSYILQDEPEHCGQDFHDDGEPGAGRIILRYMKEDKSI